MWKINFARKPLRKTLNLRKWQIQATPIQKYSAEMCDLVKITVHIG